MSFCWAICRSVLRDSCSIPSDWHNSSSLAPWEVNLSAIAYVSGSRLSATSKASWSQLFTSPVLVARLKRDGVVVYSIVPDDGGS